MLVRLEKHAGVAPSSRTPAEALSSSVSTFSLRPFSTVADDDGCIEVIAASGKQPTAVLEGIALDWFCCALLTAVALLDCGLDTAEGCC